MTPFTQLVNLVALPHVDLLLLAQLVSNQIYFPLLSAVACLARLKLVGELFKLSLFVVMIAASLGHLLEKLDLMVFLDAVELPELVELGDQ